MSWRAGPQVAGCSQSNAGVADREPMRTGKPRALSCSATRRPVLPVPPTTRIFWAFVFGFMGVIFLEGCPLGLVLNQASKTDDPVSLSHPLLAGNDWGSAVHARSSKRP